MLRVVVWERAEIWQKVQLCAWTLFNWWTKTEGSWGVMFSNMLETRKNVEILKLTKKRSGRWRQCQFTDFLIFTNWELKYMTARLKTKR